MAKTKTDISIKLTEILEGKTNEDIIVLLSNFCDVDTFNDFYKFVKDELDIVDDSDIMDIDDLFEVNID